MACNNKHPCARKKLNAKLLENSIPIDPQKLLTSAIGIIVPEIKKGDFIKIKKRRNTKIVAGC